MRKSNLYLSGILLFLGLLLLSKDVVAKSQYTFGFEAYLIDDACSMSEVNGAYDCFDLLLSGGMNDYKISNQQVTKDSQIMVVMTEETVESQISGLLLTVKPNLTKLIPYEYEISNDYTTEDIGGIYAPSICKKGICTSNWQSNNTYFQDYFTFFAYDKKRGENSTPLQQNGYLAAMFFQLKDDVSVGDTISFFYDMGKPSYFSLFDVNRIEQRDSVILNSLSLEIVGSQENKEKIESNDLEIVRYSKEELEAHPVYKNYIIGLDPTKTKSELLSKIMNDSSKLSIYDQNGNEVSDDSYIGTGFVIKLQDEEQVLDELVIVVRGDFNGDGIVNNSDLLKSLNVLQKVSEFTFEQDKAADLNKDGYFSLADHVRIYDYILRYNTSLN